MPESRQKGSGAASRESLTKAIELAGSFSHLLQRFLESVWPIPVRAEYGVDDAFEKVPSGFVGVEDADRRYRHWQGGVVANLVRHQHKLPR